MKKLSIKFGWRSIEPKLTPLTLYGQIQFSWLWFFIVYEWK